MFWSIFTAAYFFTENNLSSFLNELILVSVHCNWLIGLIVSVRGYRPCNTANTTVDICLRVENGIKK